MPLIGFDFTESKDAMLKGLVDYRQVNRILMNTWTTV
jgi:hypothetical protein